ncbi:MAG: hypothetical protein NVSMB29_07150 [Candidatus Dormibacteria bacterium]
MGHDHAGAGPAGREPLEWLEERIRQPPLVHAGAERARPAQHGEILLGHPGSQELERSSGFRHPHPWPGAAMHLGGAQLHTAIGDQDPRSGRFPQQLEPPPRHMVENGQPRSKAAVGGLDGGGQTPDQLRGQGHAHDGRGGTEGRRDVGGARPVTAADRDPAAEPDIESRLLVARQEHGQGGRSLGAVRGRDADRGPIRAA